MRALSGGTLRPQMAPMDRHIDVDRGRMESRMRSSGVVDWQTPSFRVAGEKVPGREAVLMGRGLSTTPCASHSKEDLSEWIHNQGFSRSRWGAHFNGRAQESGRPRERHRGLVRPHCDIVHHVPNPNSAHSDRRPIGKFWTGSTCMRCSN